MPAAIHFRLRRPIFIGIPNVDSFFAARGQKEIEGVYLQNRTFEPILNLEALRVLRSSKHEFIVFAECGESLYSECLPSLLQNLQIGIPTPGGSSLESPSINSLNAAQAPNVRHSSAYLPMNP